MKLCTMLLNYVTPSLNVGKEVDHHAAEADMMVLPGSWIEVFIGTVKVYEKQAAA